MERKFRDSTDFTNRNDYAVALMYLGRPAQAIEVLEQLEREKPGQYFTAANLGTAYELAGRNEEALKWIKEGIRRNPDSHDGTEWLHVKILEAKIEAARNPDYFKQHSVLDLDYSQIDRDAKSLSVGGESRAVEEVIQALEFQLQERLQFVRTKDAPVASLLFDYAAIEAGTHTLESARKLLEMAVEFGYPKNRVEPLLARYDSVIRLGLIRQYLIYISVALLLISFFIYAWRRRWIVWKRSS